MFETPSEALRVHAQIDDISVTAQGTTAPQDILVSVVKLLIFVRMHTLYALCTRTMENSALLEHVG